MAILTCLHHQNKQLELGDKMDLASYLLKPIQRMSKYALLLKDLIKECSQSQEQELSDLRTAEDMVKFQLRHGNDLLAMDAIRGCDVSLQSRQELHIRGHGVRRMRSESIWELASLVVTYMSAWRLLCR